MVTLDLIDRAGLISNVIDNKEAIVKFEMKGDTDKKGSRML